MNEITIVGQVITGPDLSGVVYDDTWASFDVLVSPPAERSSLIHQVVAFPPLEDALIEMDLKQGDEVVVVGTYGIDPAIASDDGADPQRLLERPRMAIRAQVIARDPIVAWRKIEKKLS